MRKLIKTVLLAGAVSIMYCTPKSGGEENTTSMFPVEESLPVLTVLPSRVDESSGLSFFNDQIWTQNDSGDGPKLYQVSLSEPKLLRTIKVEHADAEDWEDLTQDDEYLYIGDFGNNKGNRKDLAIYKVLRASLESPDTASVTAEKIFFNYPDQAAFNNKAYQHNFDCEAMVSLGDSLYLFSKNHQDQQCRLYSLPKTPGTYAAVLKAEMNTKGLITAADLDEETGVLALLGYNVYQKWGAWHNKPFVWLLTDFEGADFFSGRSRRIDIGIEKQTEGICFDGQGGIIISSEGEGGASGYLFFFDLKKWIK